MLYSIVQAAAEGADDSNYFFGYIGIAAALVFANLGSAYGTAKSGVIYSLFLRSVSCLWVYWDQN